MLRSFYCGALRLHPPAFRQRFADEMLSIFDHANGKAAKFNLFLDALFSLSRQWTLRPGFWHDSSSAAAPPVASDGIPSFYTISPFRPRSAAVINGLVLSMAIFCVTCFAIKYSWIHVLQIHIRALEFEGQASTKSSANSNAFRELPSQPRPERVALNNTQVAPSPPGSAPPQAAPVRTEWQQNRAHPPATSNLKSQDVSLVSPAAKPQQPASPVALPATGPAMLDPAERQDVMDETITNLKEHYVDAIVAQKMSDDLRARQKRGDYDAETDGAAFAQHLTAELRSISHDLHLEIVYSDSVLPAHAGITEEGLARYHLAMVQQNCTFEKVEILPHNIGYLKLNSFPDLSLCRLTAVTAMASLNGSNALIFDLRNNGGGQPEMVALIASYLFDHPEYWYNPRENTTQNSWTKSPVPGNKLADKPVYVLTSSRTFSGAEQFSYNLKMLKRAMLVGETTGGAAHAGVFHRIDDHFGIGIPETKAINPFATADWAEKGVEPDVRVPPSDALATALELAVAKLRKK